jgi:hypothetical protein
VRKSSRRVDMNTCITDCYFLLAVSKQIMLWDNRGMWVVLSDDLGTRTRI